MRRLGLALAVSLLACAPAQAAVRIGEREIVVTAKGARAVVEREPFRMRFTDGAGNVVLRQVPNTRPEPLPVLPLPAPQPLLADAPPPPALYAPLTFLAGGQRTAQIPVYQWVGNLLTGLEAGTAHAARDVVAAERRGHGVRLTLSTSEAGRALIVTIAPERRHALRVTVRPDPWVGVATMGDAFTARRDEAFRGFGGRHDTLDQRGRDLWNWLEQESLGAGFLEPLVSALPLSGGESFLFPGRPDSAYYAQSLMYGAGYGFLLDRDELSHWRMASDRTDAWKVDVAAPALDYVVAPGRPGRAIRTMTAINGRHTVPPEWALGPIFDRLVKFNRQTPEQYLAEMHADLDRIASERLPVTAYRVEAWHLIARDDLRALIARMRAMGIHPMLYFRAFVGRDDIGTDTPAAFDEAVRRGYVATEADGTPYYFVSNFNSVGAQIDFTNPGAVSWWQQRIREALDLGADGFMQDFGEQVLVDMRFHDGSTGASMHNRLPTLMHEATREVFEAYEREHPGRELFFYTRAGHSGSPGAAGFEFSNFPGDETTDWSRSSGLRSLATDMLNRAVGGAYGFSTDIGGFFDVGPYEATTKELFLRWAEWAVFTPVFRLHGSVDAGTHAPWTYDQETVRIYRRLSHLHARARPLILRLWRRAQRTGIPPTRPLWLAYPRHERARVQDQQWMLGRDLLVAPVVHEGARTREAWLPPGCWRHAGERHRGPGTVTVDAPLGRVPYFTRCATEPLSR